jgi:hypothetical protein
MPDVDVPGLEADDAPPLAPRDPRYRRTWLLKIALEVVLIGTGVFLGLVADQWRDTVKHRELAQASLRRFRAELQRNRDNVAAVKDRHATKLKALNDYFTAHAAELVRHAADPRAPLPLPPSHMSTSPAFFEYSAWDVALATQSSIEPLPAPARCLENDRVATELTPRQPAARSPSSIVCA